MDSSQIVLASFKIIMLATAPVLLVAMIVGILVGLVQSVVQVQDQTVSYVLKLAAVCVTLLASAHWIMRQISGLFDLILGAVPVAVAWMP
jgi:type III secretory pathway component EscS